MDYAKMAALAHDPKAIRRVAKALLKSLDEQLGDRARKFLNQLAAFDGEEPLSGRQQEFLYSLISRQKGRRETVGGYRACKLIEELHLMHMDLDEDSEEFVEEKYAFGPALALTENQWGYVFALCKKHKIIDHWVNF
jgi:hypothetical protein